MKEKTPLTPTTTAPRPSAAMQGDANRDEPSVKDGPVASGPPLQANPAAGLSVSLGKDAD